MLKASFILKSKWNSNELYSNIVSGFDSQKSQQIFKMFKFGGLGFLTYDVRTSPCALFEYFFLFPK